jgi:hypothetical protein
VATDPKATEKAKEFIDKALSERQRLGYRARVSKASYGRAVNQAADAFEKLERSTTEDAGRSS